jgi:hypothetical protein
MEISRFSTILEKSSLLWTWSTFKGVFGLVGKLVKYSLLLHDHKSKQNRVVTVPLINVKETIEWNLYVILVIKLYLSINQFKSINHFLVIFRPNEHSAGRVSAKRGWPVSYMC